MVTVSEGKWEKKKMRKQINIDNHRRECRGRRNNKIWYISSQMPGSVYEYARTSDKWISMNILPKSCGKNVTYVFFALSVPHILKNPRQNYQHVKNVCAIFLLSVHFPQTIMKDFFTPLSSNIFVYCSKIKQQLSKYIYFLVRKQSEFFFEYTWNT